MIRSEQCRKENVGKGENAGYHTFVKKNSFNFLKKILRILIKMTHELFMRTTEERSAK